MSEYREALQHPQIAFKEPNLKQGVVEQTPLGLPKLVSGGFALTACVTTQTSGCQSTWAIRCFHKQAPDLQDRYKHISEFLQDRNEAFFVKFNYQPEGIKVGNNWHPIVRMDWVEGQPFHEFVEANLSNPSRLQNLAEQIKLMSNRLNELGMAHGDLQHGNILVRHGKLVLIDYDGMYVPGMPYQTSNETGLSAFQHPRRDRSFFNGTIDRFSSIAIYISLLCIASPKGPELWRQYHTGENLIFTQHDYRDPGNSNLFTEIQRHLENKPNRELKRLVDTFQQICLTNLENIPSLDQFIDRQISLPIPLSRPLKAISPKSPRLGVVGYVGKFKTFSAHDILKLIKQEGERIAVVGRVSHISEYKEATYINFEEPNFFSKIKGYKSFAAVIYSKDLNKIIYSKGFNGLSSNGLPSKIKKLRSSDLKQFEGKYLKITGLLELIEIDKSNVTPQIIIENAHQLIGITEGEANSVLPSPSKPSQNPFLCSSCTYHLDDTCPIQQRPYVKSCNVYQGSSKQTAHRLSVKLLEQFFGSLTQKNFSAKQWSRAARLILQRIQLILQTASNPGRLPLQLKILSGAGAIGLIWCAFLFSVREVSPLDTFKPLISEYYTASGLKNLEKSKRHRTKPYIKGKIISVEIEKGRWTGSDYFYSQLPKDLRATKPEDVGTIVLLEWKIGYTSCKVKIIDKSLKIIVNEKNFEGYPGYPGSIPTQKIINYLRGLPKK